MISILIPSTPKTKKYLDFCRESLEENTLGDFEILIAENGKDTPHPQGQCAAVNRVAKEAQGEWLLISNDDMYYPPAWNRNLKYISECISPNVNWTAAPISELEYVELPAGDSLENFNKEMVDNFVPTNTVENGFHFPVIIKKSLWDKIGGYDEMYDPWGSNSDSDLEYKIILAGVQPKIARGVFVYHFGMKSGTFGEDTRDYWQKNWEYFIEKWGFPRVDTPRIQKADVIIDMEKLKMREDWSVYG
jgi:GT2 family glycosyltransferase